VSSDRLPEPIDVRVGSIAPERLIALLTPEQAARARDALALAGPTFAGRTVWNVNSTATGGGVAEMLQSLLAYARGAAVDARWVVIQGDAEFFTITKRIHNHLHGAPGDGGALDTKAREHYEAVLNINATSLARRFRPDDIVILHDPQTAGLIPLLRSAPGLPVVWRCHVGADEPNSLARKAWDFLRPYVQLADACIFSRQAFVWAGLDKPRIAIIGPSIDPFAPKNYDIPIETVITILHAAGIEDSDRARGEPVFQLQDGSIARVTRAADVTEVAPIGHDTPLVLQVSRWDRLKDPLGVMHGFVNHVTSARAAHLMLAGPAVTGVSDDPEGLAVFTEVHRAWQALPPAARERVHLASLPMTDVEENAVMVNALQRRADVVVQKSLAEGFGLTVAEAMWKARPMVASRVGGIQDQVVDGVSGTLVAPTDLAAFGRAVDRYLSDRELARLVGEAARERVREHYLGSRHLIQYLELLSGLMSPD
jgi:trehalose synthase